MFILKKCLISLLYVALVMVIPYKAVAGVLFDEVLPIPSAFISACTGNLVQAVADTRVLLTSVVTPDASVREQLHLFSMNNSPATFYDPDGNRYEVTLSNSNGSVTYDSVGDPLIVHVIVPYVSKVFNPDGNPLGTDIGTFQFNADLVAGEFDNWLLNNRCVGVGS